VVPIVQAGIDLFGWQGALWAMAAVSILAMPLALPLADRPGEGQHGQKHEGRQEGAARALKGALSTGHFWCLFFGFFVCGLHVSFLTVHLPGFVASCGLHPSWGPTRSRSSACSTSSARRSRASFRAAGVVVSCSSSSEAPALR